MFKYDFDFILRSLTCAIVHVIISKTQLKKCTFKTNSHSCPLMIEVFVSRNEGYLSSSQCHRTNILMNSGGELLL